MDICVILCTMDSRGGTMKATAEQISLEYEEELTVCCYDPGRSENRAGQKLLPVNG